MASIKDLRNSLTKLANLHCRVYDDMDNELSFPMKAMLLDAKKTALACARFGRFRHWSMIQEKLLTIRNADRHCYSMNYKRDKSVVLAAIMLFNEALPAKQRGLRIVEKNLLR